MGSATTASTCFSPSGAGINDVDRDGMSDGCELRLAQRFSPMMAVAPSTYDCAPTIEPYWAAKYFPSHSSIVRIAYLLAYRRDCGDTGIGSAILALLAQSITLNGFINNVTQSFGLKISTDDPGDGHSGDSEFVMIDIRFDSGSQHWVLASVEFSAHFGTSADGTARWGAKYIEYPDGVQLGLPRVWAAKNKHANYVSREQCNAGRGPLGAVHDNCDPNIPSSYRLTVGSLRNVGSRHANLINPGTCVPSSQPSFYPGTECFWKPGDHFNGWLQYPYGHPPTAYYDILVLEFECYAYTMDSPRQCSDFGVVR
jgi:hypothetical protein